MTVKKFYTTQKKSICAYIFFLCLPWNNWIHHETILINHQIWRDDNETLDWTNFSLLFLQTPRAPSTLLSLLLLPAKSFHSLKFCNVTSGTEISVQNLTFLNAHWAQAVEAPVSTNDSVVSHLTLFTCHTFGRSTLDKEFLEGMLCLVSPLLSSSVLTVLFSLFSTVWCRNACFTKQNATASVNWFHC